ncbi:hypothetical protein [Clostridium gasigenes]|uniref:hypothetical protein n=1 Tax=Clostridium gasigenes TaxID=94869 RepID=UPI001C0CA690|nr:hypothetical protein [Clostridium gasigenes]MBU3102969.1 hypothetical protein [Clostridium gasigenes]
MKNEKFKLIEKTLYEFYEDQKSIKTIEREIYNLKAQYEEIGETLRSSRFNIEEQSSSPDFSEKVQSSSDCTSYVEKQMIKRVEILQREQQLILDKEVEREGKLRAIRRSSEGMKANIEMLSEEYKTFIKLKYAEKKAIEQIYPEINKSRSLTFELRGKIIEEIARWEYMIMEMNYHEMQS